jgi:heavy metal translocating P-type ATPase
MSARAFSAALFGVTVASLAAGLAGAWVGDPARAGLFWAAGAAAVLAVLAVEIVRSLSRGAFGLDVIAALAMAGCLAAGEMLAACVVALMFSGGQLLEGYAQGRAEREMTALLSRVPRRARLLRDHSVVEVPLEAVRAGDRVLVRPGEVVPVDGLLMDERAVLDESAMSGESLPVTRERGEPVTSGTTNAGGAFTLDATSDASRSTFARIVALVEGARSSRAPAARLADRWSVGFLVFTVALSGGVWMWTGEVSRALAVLVVATPCPLLLAVPVAIVAGLSRAARAGVLVKSASALERMAALRTLLLDKTGTLTTGTPRVTGVSAEAGCSAAEVLRLAASLAQGSPHVVSSALVLHALQAGESLTTPEAVHEEHGAGVVGVVAGRKVALGSGGFIQTHTGLPVSTPPGEASRLLTHVALDGRPAGVLTLEDTLRPEAAGTLEAMRRAGITRIVLVTGDRADVAEGVAAGLAIDRIAADQTPEGKVAVVREEGEVARTAMVGDGVNDAPALAAADVGIAMGARGAAASSEAADAVILVDALDRLPLALAAARRSLSIARQSVAAGMGLSVLAMGAATLGWLTPLQGALLQEAIDVAVVLNALRALSGGALDGARPGRAGRAVAGRISSGLPAAH